MKLSEGVLGKKYRVDLIDGGCMAKDRLWKLGVIPGVILRIKRKAPMSGPLMVEINGVDIVIGRGIASKIRIQEIE